VNGELYLEAVGFMNEASDAPVRSDLVELKTDEDMVRKHLSVSVEAVYPDFISDSLFPSCVCCRVCVHFTPPTGHI